MIAPDDLTKLPVGGLYTLTRDTRVDGQDLQRFIDIGGKISPQSYKLFIDRPAPIGPSVLEMTPHGQTMTIFGRILTVPPGAMITGAYPDGNGGCGTGVQLIPAGPHPSMESLKAGDLVYRVAEDDPPGKGLHTWKIACVEVERASARQVKLKRNLPGLGRVLYQQSALGRVFFETPLQAIQFFLTERRLEMEAFDRRKKETERAIAWATSQEGMTL